MRGERKIGGVAGLTALSAIWGWFGWLVVLWILCMAVDYATGTAVACKRGKWISGKARDGIWGKLGSLTVVLVAVGLDVGIGLILTEMDALPFTYTVLLSPIVISWYILTEMGSILENAAALGAPMPSFLVRWIAALRRKVEWMGEE